MDGIALVIHMTRREGRRFVEESLFVKGYEAAENRWVIQPVWPPEAQAPLGGAREGALRILVPGAGSLWEEMRRRSPNRFRSA